MADERTAWLGTKQAAAYLGVSVRFIYRHQKSIRPTFVVGGRFRYTKDSLDAWLEKQRWPEYQSMRD